MRHMLKDVYEELSHAAYIMFIAVSYRPLVMLVLDLDLALALNAWYDCI